MEKQRKAYSYIRFSTEQQSKGDSLNRQLKETKKYCEEHNLILDESTTLKDLGLSAYHGIHKIKGALGKFLKLVEDGKIEKGSILIVESLDRLSRENVLTALSQFLDIIKAGIKLVTLSDGMEYTQESIVKNWTELIISLAIMARANEESLKKSIRIRAAKQKNRNLARTTKRAITARGMHWLKLDKETRKFEVIPYIVIVIRKAFELKLKGYGAVLIAQQLNKDPNTWKPPVTKLNKSGGWSATYIIKLLRNKAVLGEFQPTVSRSDGKSLNDGEPIKDYFPRVISDDLFYAVQDRIDKDSGKKGKSGGRKSKARNILASVAVCGNCGGSLYYNESSDPKRFSASLVCINKTRAATDKNGKRICDVKPFKYDEVVDIVLKELEKLDIEKLFETDEEKNKIEMLKQHLIALETKSKDLERKSTNLIEELENEDDATLRKMISNRIKQLNEENEEVKKEYMEKNNAFRQLSNKEQSVKENIEKIKTLKALKEKMYEDNEQARAIRLELNSQISDLCEFIKIHPLKEEYVPMQEVEPGIYHIMKSKKIDNIHFRFNTGVRLFNTEKERKEIGATVHLNTYSEKID